MAVLMSGRFAGADLASVEADVLFHIGHGGGDRLAIGRLRRAAGRTPSTITAIVDRLEGAGLVVRAPNPEDRRSFLIVLTPRGKRVARAVGDRVDQIERGLQRNLARAQVEGFHAVVEALEGWQA